MDNDTGIHVVEHPVRREKDSVDDFEHLGLDNSPTQGDENPATTVSFTARDLLGEIDKTAETAENVANKIIEKSYKPTESLLDTKMDSNIFEMGDTLLDKAADADDKMDNFISQLTSFAPSVPSHEVSPIIEERKNQFDGIKNFLDMEREKIDPLKAPQEHINLEKTTKFIEPVTDDFLISDVNIHENQPEIFTETLLEELKKPEVHAEKPFEKKPELPVENTAEKHKFISEVVAPTPPPSLINEPVIAEILPSKAKETHPEVHKVEEAPPLLSKTSSQAAAPEKKLAQEPPPVHSKTVPAKSKVQLEPVITDAEVIFKKMGLDAWFHPERLNPRVESLIYWRDPTKSGPVFGGVLVILLALTYLSLISVVAYLSLLALTATISFRIYKTVLQAVQKTGDGHPFKEFLEMDINLPQEKVKEFVETAIAHLNAAAIELRRLFLVDDLVDSIKFGVLLWCLTYLGAWFNGMTLVIIAWVALFTLPKVYETNKTQIDANLDLVRSKIAEITSKVKAAIPIGKKVEEKKDQ